MLIFISLISFAVGIIILISILSIQINTKRTRQYTYMQLNILEKIALKEGIEIDIKNLYNQAKENS